MTTEPEIIEIGPLPYDPEMSDEDRHHMSARWAQAHLNDTLGTLQFVEEEMTELARRYKMKCEELDKLKTEVLWKDECVLFLLEFIKNTHQSRAELTRRLKMEREIMERKRFLMIPCLQILDEFKSEVYEDITWPFLKPFNYVDLGLLDYPTVITEPRDLETIRKKCEDLEYSSISAFFDDLELMCDNCMKYHPGSDPLNFLGAKMAYLVLTKMREMMNSDVLLYSAAAVTRYWQKPLADIFRHLYNNRNSWIFMDPVRHGAMSFTEMKRKLDSGAYLTPAAMQADMRLLLDAFFQRYPEGDLRHAYGVNMKSAFDEMMTEARNGPRPPMNTGAFRCDLFDSDSSVSSSDDDDKENELASENDPPPPI